MMAKALAFALSVAAFSCAMSQDMTDVDKILAADAECATGEGMRPERFAAESSGCPTAGRRLCGEVRCCFGGGRRGVGS